MRGGGEGGGEGGGGTFPPRLSYFGKMTLQANQLGSVQFSSLVCFYFP